MCPAESLPDSEGAPPVRRIQRHSLKVAADPPRHRFGAAHVQPEQRPAQGLAVGVHAHRALGLGRAAHRHHPPPPRRIRRQQFTGAAQEGLPPVFRLLLGAVAFDVQGDAVEGPGDHLAAKGDQGALAAGGAEVHHQHQAIEGGGLDRRGRRGEDVRFHGRQLRRGGPRTAPSGPRPSRADGRRLRRCRVRAPGYGDSGSPGRSRSPSGDAPGRRRSR